MRSIRPLSWMRPRSALTRQNEASSAPCSGCGYAQTAPCSGVTALGAAHAMAAYSACWGLWRVRAETRGKDARRGRASASPLCEGDSGGATAAFHRCRSEVGADSRAGGRLVVVGSEHVRLYRDTLALAPEAGVVRGGSASLGSRRPLRRPGRLKRSLATL